MASITLNKNSVPGGWGVIRLWHLIFVILLGPCTHNLKFDYLGDKSALVPGGIRIGAPAMTTRGFTENEFTAVADFIHEGVQITLESKKLVSGSKLQDFMTFVTSPDFPLADQVAGLRRRVEAVTTQYPLPGL